MNTLRLAILLGMLCLASCTDATCSKVTALGNESKVELYSGGKKIAEWESTGRVADDESGAGFYFRDKTSGKLIRVQGTAIVTEK